MALDRIARINEDNSMSDIAPPLRTHPLHGYLYYDPPSDEFLAEHYERKYFQQNAIYSSDYSAEEREFFLATARRKISMVKGFLGGSLPPGFRCLELGVGEGWSLAALKAAGVEAHGIDYSNHGLAKWHPELVELVTLGSPETELDSLVAAGKLFDLIWLDNVLEHVPRPEPFLDKVFGALKPGGFLLIEVPNDGSPLQKFLHDKHLIEREFWHAYPEHLSYFTETSLRSLLQSHGFSVADVMADFPIDLFLLNDASNYVNNSAVGKSAHRARLRFEQFASQFDEAAVVELYRAMARMTLGRNLVVLCVKQATGESRER